MSDSFGSILGYLRRVVVRRCNASNTTSVMNR